MNPLEFEEYVSELVRQLDCFKKALIQRNHKFKGVRQPGEYEIDVAVKVQLSDTIDFLLIVECKNWRRPVDRPVIQKLAQTKDAISAHKAAVASPMGFTKEAMEVAKAHNIALWVISEYSWTIVKGVGPLEGVDDEHEQYRARVRYLGEIGFNVERRYNNEMGLVEFSHVIREISQDRPWVKFKHNCLQGLVVRPGSGFPGVDHRLAATGLADHCGILLGRTPVVYHTSNSPEF